MWRVGGKDCGSISDQASGQNDDSKTGNKQVPDKPPWELVLQGGL